MPDPTPIQRREHEAMLRRQGAYERAFAGHIRAVLRKQYNAAAALVERSGPQAFTFREDIIIAPEQYEAAYKSMYQRVGTQEAKESWRLFVKPVLRDQKQLIEDIAETESEGEEQIGRLEFLWRRLMADFFTLSILSRINQVTETTKNRIESVIQTGIDQRLTDKQIAIALRKDARGEISRNRAMLIGRTETLAAMNQGQLLAIRSSPFVYEKGWMPILDGRERPAHGDMRNAPFIPSENDFFVMGEEMAYPGDPRGSAANTVNCRCGLFFRVLRDSSGAPIRKRQRELMLEL